MDIEDLKKRLKQANEIAAEAITETGDKQTELWDKANKVEASIQTDFDSAAEGLYVEWSTAYSEYIIRAE